MLGETRIVPRSASLNRDELLARQAFQLGLIDRLRGLDDPAEIMATTSAAVGIEMAVARVGYADVERDAETVQITQDWTDGSVPTMVGITLRLDAFGREAVDELRQGRTLIVADAATDPRLVANRESWEAIQTQAVVACPQIRDGQIVALLYVHQSRPHAWTEAEVALVEDCALRTQETVERARAEAALRGSEQRYRSLFNSIDAGFCVVEMHFAADGTAADYRFLEVNDAFERYTGIANARGRRMREIAATYEQHFDAFGQVALTGQPVRFEMPARQLGDRWYLVHAYRVDAPELHHVAILFTDLTARRRAERVLEQNRSELELATRVARLGRYDYRPRAGTLIWDDRCRALFGLSPGAPVTYETAFIAGLHPDDRAAADAAVAAALDPRGSRQFDTEYRTIGIEDGVERHIAAHGIAFFSGDTPVRLIGTVQDVTEDRRAQAHLRETEERLRLAARATNDAIWDWDLRRDFVQWNDALERAYGHRPEGVGPDGAWWLGQIHPEDRARIDASIHAVIDADGTDWTAEYRFRRADGSYADVLDRGYVIRDEEGVAIRMIGAMLDLSPHKELERQLLRDKAGLQQTVVETTADRDRAEEALRQAQKMEAVGQLTGGLAHDFNNLLAGISGALEMMQVRIRQGRTGELERYAEVAQASVKRAAAVTHRLLAFSRRQTLDPRAVDPNRLVTGMADLIRRTVGPGTEVEIAAAPGLWATMVDPNQLENALLNLCINARDAMPGGGRITIRTENCSFDARDAPAVELVAGDYVALRVGDTGTGMTEEVAARAFDPFYTTKPLGEGTGLGLSMIYGFARQSGGQVRIATEIGRGTTMSIYLPRHCGAAEAPAGIAPAPGLTAHAGTAASVLVVDDEAAVRMLVGEVVAEIGSTAIEAADGPQAMAILDGGAAIDLLITDIGLPGAMNGRQIADAARATRPGLKVLFITGYAEHSVLGPGRLPPNTALLTKPFTIDALGARIRELIG